MGKRLVAGIAVALAVVMITVIAFTLGARSSDGEAARTAALGDVAFDAGVPAETAALKGAAPDVDTAAETARADAPAVVEPEIVSSVADQPGGPHEGIKVHGRWTIEVTEPDGRFVSRTEFDNALLLDGRLSLAQFLARQSTPGLWEIRLNGQPTDPCNTSSGTASACTLEELPATDPLIVNNPNRFGGMLVEAPYSLVLTGAVTAANATGISAVGTKVFRCPPSLSPNDVPAAACSPTLFKVFTSKVLDSVVPVLPDQVINVTVEISFS